MFNLRTLGVPALFDFSIFFVFLFWTAIFSLYFDCADRASPTFGRTANLNYLILTCHLPFQISGDFGHPLGEVLTGDKEYGAVN